MDTGTELKKILKKEGVDKLEAAPKKEEPVEIKKPAESTKQEQPAEKTEEQADTEVTQKRVEIRRPPKPPPKLDNIIDCLHYKVTYNQRSYINNYGYS